MWWLWIARTRSCWGRNRCLGKIFIVQSLRTKRSHARFQGVIFQTDFPEKKCVDWGVNYQRRRWWWNYCVGGVATPKHKQHLITAFGITFEGLNVPTRGCQKPKNKLGGGGIFTWKIKGFANYFLNCKLTNLKNLIWRILTFLWQFFDSLLVNLMQSRSVIWSFFWCRFTIKS